MSGRIGLALTLHNHQPVGNFGWVIEDTYRTAYQPMVDALEGHPSVRMALHYTGPLLEWFASEKPEFLDRIRAMRERGQVEILGGGHFEPVLASIPERDRISQLRRMADEVERLFGHRPRTAWLAERVWEPDLPTSLVAAGYSATILDDAHLRAAGVPEDAMWGPFSTDDQGSRLTVFGTEQGLRYRIPFRPVPELIEYLRDHATEDGERLGTMGDDGEKFGGWPSTWEHCWGKGAWIEEFLVALESNSSWLTTTTPSDWLAAHAPLGRIYVPGGSYAEMGAWALPPGESRAFTRALEQDRAEGRPEPRWMRGASWRNFQVKYREINDIHKRMLRLSDRVAGMPDGPTRDRAHDHLLRGQSNDIYWHGLFGGIYLADLRLATIGQLIAAEDAVDGATGSMDRAVLADLDLDGRDEVLLSNDGQVVTVNLDDGAGIADWDLRAARYALTSVLRRRPEAYHDAIRQQADGDGQADPSEAHMVDSIDGTARFKEAGLADHLRYDDHERRSGLVRFLPVGATSADFGGGELPDLGSALGAPHRVVELADGRLVVEATASVGVAGASVPILVRKSIELGGGRLSPALRVHVTIRNVGDRPIRARLGLEWALMLLGGGGNPAAWYEVGGQRWAHDSAGAASGVEVVRQGNDWADVALYTIASPAADAWWAPIETISNSEAGFERVYQGSSLLLSWPLDLAAGAERTVSLEHRVTITKDRRASEDGRAR